MARMREVVHLLIVTLRLSLPSDSPVQGFIPQTSYRVFDLIDNRELAKKTLQPRCRMVQSDYGRLEWALKPLR